jgi:hypothetical protein
LWVGEELRCRRCEGGGPRKYRLQGARMNDAGLLMPAKLKDRVPYMPNPEDADVARCRAERDRVLKERSEKGEFWWRLAS